MALAQGRQPAFIRSTGTRCWRKEDEAGPESELDQGVPVEAVKHPPGGAHGPVFLDGEGVDGARHATVEVAGGGVVDGVRLAPVGVGREREHAQDSAGPVVGGLGREERSVPAVVLDHEDAHQEGRGRNREQEPGPPAPLNAHQRGRPEQGEGDERHRHFE
jgi:hypothetical protein